MRITSGSITACLSIALAMALPLDGGAVSVGKAASTPAKIASTPARPSATGPARKGFTRVEKKGLTRAQKLKRALGACKREKSESKRKACELKARTRYGPRSKKPSTRGPTSTAPRTNTPKSTVPRTPEEERIGFTRVTLECPATAVVGKTISISGTGAAGALLAINYNTPTSGGTQRVKDDSSGHYSFSMTAQEAGTYTFLASSEGVTSNECTTQAM